MSDGNSGARNPVNGASGKSAAGIGAGAVAGGSRSGGFWMNGRFHIPSVYVNRSTDSIDYESGREYSALSGASIWVNSMRENLCRSN